MVEINDAILLLHPAIAVLFVLPLIGMVINLAWQTRQRRLQNAGGGKSKIPPVVGPVLFIVLLFAATIASLVFLYRAEQRLWRGVFATLTGAGLIVLGCQDGVFRRTNEWYVCHYYIGINAAMLMIFSLAIVPDIYKDRSNRWRIAHTVLNCIALLLFVGQGMTGTRDLLEIPLGWQEPYVYKCDFNNKTCPTPAPPVSQNPATTQ